MIKNFSINTSKKIGLLFAVAMMAFLNPNDANAHDKKHGYTDKKTGVKHPRSEKYIGIRMGRSWNTVNYTNSKLKNVGENNGRDSFDAENRGFDLGVVAGFSKELNDVEISLELGLDYNFQGETVADQFDTPKDPVNATAITPVRTQLLGKRSLTLDADLKIGTTFENDHIRPRLILGFTVARMQAYDHTEPEKIPYQTPYGVNMGAEIEGKLSEKFAVVANYRYKNFHRGGIKGHALHFGVNRKF